MRNTTWRIYHTNNVENINTYFPFLFSYLYTSISYILFGCGTHRRNRKSAKREAERNVKQSRRTNTQHNADIYRVVLLLCNMPLRFEKIFTNINIGKRGKSVCENYRNGLDVFFVERVELLTAILQNIYTTNCTIQHIIVFIVVVLLVSWSVNYFKEKNLFPYS